MGSISSNDRVVCSRLIHPQLTIIKCGKNIYKYYYLKTLESHQKQGKKWRGVKSQMRGTSLGKKYIYTAFHLKVLTSLPGVEQLELKEKERRSLNMLGSKRMYFRSAREIWNGGAQKVVCYRGGSTKIWVKVCQMP